MATPKHADKVARSSAEPKTTRGTAPKGKLGLIVQLLRSPEGADIGSMQAATGWRPHSIRGAIAGSLKRKHGLVITSEKSASGRIYRLSAGVGS